MICSLPAYPWRNNSIAFKLVGSYWQRYAIINLRSACLQAAIICSHSLSGVGHRLFAQHMLARFGGANRVLRMHAVGQRDVDRVNRRIVVD